MGNAPAELCIECGKEIRDGEKYLIVSGADGKKQLMHTACFTVTTFDPERFANVTDPEGE